MSFGPHGSQRAILVGAGDVSNGTIMAVACPAMEG